MKKLDRIVCLLVCLTLLSGMMVTPASAGFLADSEYKLVKDTGSVRVYFYHHFQDVYFGETSKAERWDSEQYYDVRLVRNGKEYATTRGNGCFLPYIRVDGKSLGGGYTVQGPHGDSDHEDVGSSLSFQTRCDAVGGYAKLIYNVTNHGSTAKTFDVAGSFDAVPELFYSLAWDRSAGTHQAEGLGNGKGMKFTNLDYKDENFPGGFSFNVLTPTCNAIDYVCTPYGKYAYTARENFETETSGKEFPYNIFTASYAWLNETVQPGETWSRYVLVGAGDLLGAPTLNGMDLIVGREVNLTGTAPAEATKIYLQIGNTTYSGDVKNGRYTVPVNLPASFQGKTALVSYWAEGEAGVSLAQEKTLKVLRQPAIKLAPTSTTVIEDSALDAAWYNGFIKSSEGNVTHTSVNTAKLGNQTVTYTAATTGFSSATANLSVNVLPLPAELTQTTATQSGKNYNLTAKMPHTGGLTYTETGFVYGTFQNPNLDFCDGTAKTSGAVNTKNGTLSATATDLIDGVTYYARAYAKAGDGTVIYGPQSSGFGLNVPSYGTFHVKHKGGGTFTIYRDGGDGGTQKVYYRTVNGSAVGSMNDNQHHFRHTDGVLTFADGETTKDVTVTEHGANAEYSGVATKYANADRTYQMEINRVEGGAIIDQNHRFAERNMGHSSSYTVDRNVYTTEHSGGQVSPSSSVYWVADHSGGDAADIWFVNDRGKNSGTDANYSFTYKPTYNEYLQNTITGWLYRYSITAHETENGYEHVWVGKQAPSSMGSSNNKVAGGGAAIPLNSSVGTALFTGSFEMWEKNDLTVKVPQVGCGVADACDGRLRSANGTGNMKTVGSDSYLVMGKDDTAYCYFSANGSGKEYWYIQNHTSYDLPLDTTEPHLIDVAYMARNAGTTTYLPGDPITVSLVFDEIVDAANSAAAGLKVDESFVTLKDWSVPFYYKGGAGTNILYFTAITPEDAPTGQSNLKVSNVNCAGQIKDMAGNACTGGTASSTAPVASNPAPTVGVGTITNNSGTLSAAITATNADRLEYVWTTTPAAEGEAPTYGWKSLTDKSGGTVTTRQSSGTWYLYARATNADGRVAKDKSGPVTIPTSGSGALVLPDLAVSVDNSAWAKTRTVTVTKTPGDAAVTCTAKPAGATVTPSGGNFTVDRNGSYTFQLTSGSETVSRTVSVSKLDVAAPTVTIDALDNGKTYIEPVTLTVNVADSESGLSGAPTGTWNKTGGGSQSATLTKVSDGVYSSTCPVGTSGVETWTLTVNAGDAVGNQGSATSPAYTMDYRVPAITVTQTGTSNKGYTYSYTVAKGGAEIVSIDLPDGSRGINEENGSLNLSGTFTITQPGTYYASATDGAGRVAVSGPLVVPENQNIDGVPPEVWLTPSTFEWTRGPLTAAVTVYDAGSASVPTAKRENNTALALSNGTMGAGHYKGSFTISENGDYTVTATDANGNVGTGSVTISNIDTTGPAIGEPTGNPTNWTKNDATIAFAVTDTQSGLQTVTVKKGGTDVPVTNTSGNCSFTATENGDYIITATDAVGNSATKEVEVTKLDKTEPTISVSGGATAADRLELTVTASNPGGSGVTTTVSKDGGTAETVAGGKYTVTAAGTYTFTATTGTGQTSSHTVTVHSIAFDAQGGSAVDSQIVVSGGKVTPPTTAKTGYTLSGWKNGAADWDPDASTVTADATLTAQWTLDPPTVTVTANPENGTATYTGSPVVTLTANPTHAAAGVSYSFQWYKGDTQLNGETGATLSLTNVSDSGSYKAAVTASDGTLTSAQGESTATAVTIAKAAPALSDLSATAITYGDALTASTPNGTATDPETGTNLSGTWTWTSADAAATFPTVVTDSGKTAYSVTFTPSDADNYGPATATVTLTVNKATLTPSVNTVSNKVYDGQTGTTGTIKLTGAKFADAPEAVGTFAFNSPNVTGANAVNVTGIALTGDWGGNYVLDVTALTDVPTTARITPKPVTLTWNGADGLVYNGSPVNVTATAGELVEGDTCNVTVTGGRETNAGTYTATAVSLDNPNYQLPETVTRAYTIAKCPVTFTVAHDDVDYHHGAYPKAEVTADPALTKDRDFAVSYRQTGEVIEPHFSGSYDVMARLNNENYKFEGQDDALREMKVGELTIHHVSYEGTITWPTASNPITYGQSLREVAFAGGSGSTVGGAGSFAWKEPDSFPDAATAKAVMVFDPDDTEYDSVEYEIDIQVNKATLTPSVDAVESKVYDGTGTTTGTLSLTGAQFGEAPTATGTFHFVDKNVAAEKAVNVTAITLTDNWNDNYVLRVTELAGVATHGEITPKTVSLTWNGDQDLVYSGQSVNVTATAGDLVEGDVCAVTVDDGGRATDAGTHTATATALSDPNYQLPEAVTHDYAIAPKPVTLLWHNMIQPYNGTDRAPKAVTSPDAEGGGSAVTLQGVVPEDDGTADVIISVTQSGESAQAIDAGTYLVSAAMAGGSNYVVTGYDAAQLTVQKAPVSFAVTNNTLKEGGARHGATITPSPAGVPFTAVYKTREGEVVDPQTQDLKRGTYPIWVTITDENYHHVGSATGNAAQVGVFTVYAQDPPPKYAVKFEADDPKDEPDAEGGVIGVLTGGTEPLDAAGEGTLRVLPQCGFTCTGYAFAGWKLGDRIYPAGAAYTQPGREVTFTAQWVKTVHTVEGVVDRDGNPVADVQVTLMLGSHVVAQRHTDARGQFRFENIAPGLYNLVAAKDGVTMTVEVTIVDQDEARNITLPTHKTNSVVVVTPGTPDVVVGNLENNFTPEDKALAAEAVSTEVEYKFTVRQEAENENNAVHQAIRQAARGATPQLYLELTLEKTVTEGDTVTTDVMSESNVLIESVISLPAELQGKYSYSVIRCHGEGEGARAEALTGSPNDAGEYFQVNRDKTVLTICAKKFSTYAIAYSNYVESGPDKPIILQPENGTVTLAPEGPQRGAVGTITVTPDEGYEVGTVIVTKPDGTTVEVAVEPDGTFTFIQPRDQVTISVTLKKVGGAAYAACPRDNTCPIWPYQDASTTAWYHDGVHFCVERSLMVGTSETTFAPEMDTSRAMIATILWRLQGSPAVNGSVRYPDVAEGTWYTEAVRWATQAGVVKGYGDGNFGPGDPITREQLAAMLYRYEQKFGGGGFTGMWMFLLDFRDADRVSDWADEAMHWMTMHQVITGKEGKTLDPQGQATRAEAAAMIQRFLTLR